MDVNEYQRWTRTVAVYSKEKSIEYLGFGVGNEWGESVEKVQGGADKEAILDELGDYNWYLARLSDELGIEFESLLGTFDTELDPDLISTIGDITTSCIFKLQGVIKKHVRGDFDTEELSKRSLEYLEALVSGLEIMLGDYSMETLAQRNHDKLMARKEKGTLKGDGDNR